MMMKVFLPANHSVSIDSATVCSFFSVFYLSQIIIEIEMIEKARRRSKHTENHLKQAVAIQLV